MQQVALAAARRTETCPGFDISRFASGNSMGGARNDPKKNVNPDFLR